MSPKPYGYEWKSVLIGPEHIGGMRYRQFNETLQDALNALNNDGYDVFQMERWGDNQMMITARRENDWRVSP